MTYDELLAREERSEIDFQSAQRILPALVISQPLKDHRDTGKDYNDTWEEWTDNLVEMASTIATKLSDYHLGELK